MKKLFEYEVVQNPVLGATAITQAVIEYYKVKEGGMPLPLVMAVLPVVFHRKTIELIASMDMVGGGLLRALGRDRTLKVGLQQRMEGMAELSFRALNIALSCRKCLVLNFDKDVLVVPCRKSVPAADMGYKDGDAKEVVKAAMRIGHWFGAYSMGVICYQLDLRF